jgi:tetratricopeptide (TPR) repeat protein
MRSAVNMNSGSGAQSPAFQRALEAARAGRGAEAEALLRELVDREPASADAWFLLGATLASRREFGEGASALRRALALRPDFHAAWRALANALLATGEVSAAQEALQRAATLRPDDLESRASLAALLNNEGLAHFAAGRFVEAEAAHRRALAAKPDLHEALNNLGNALAKLDRAEEAIACYRRVLSATPNRADVRSNLAFALRKLGRVEEALAAYERALEIDPRYLDALNHGGFVLQELGRWDEAAARYARALEVDPGSAYAAYNLALVSFFRRDFATGWPSYEARYRTDPPITADRRLAIPRLTASDWPRVRRLAIWLEQGIGDCILYATVLPELEARGIEFVLETDARLVSAFRRAHPHWRVVSPAESPSAFGDCDFHAPIATLAGLLRPSVESFPAKPPPLLAADAARVQESRRSFDGDERKRVAIAWRSLQPKGREALASQKSAPLEVFLPLSQRDDVRLVDLQYGETSAEREAFARAGGALSRIEGLDLFNDLDGVLAAIAACDLVVTTSNVTAHLAGALGRETWLIHAGAKPAFFYWMPNPDGHSLWYPSVKIIGAGAGRGWKDVLATVSRRLDATIGKQ